jgi:hypothetical protein
MEKDLTRARSATVESNGSQSTAASDPSGPGMSSRERIAATMTPAAKKAREEAKAARANKENRREEVFTEMTGTENPYRKINPGTTSGGKSRRRKHKKAKKTKKHSRRH